MQVIEYLAEMPAETPVAFGFHPNAEIGFKLREGDAFCNSLILMQVRTATAPASLSPLLIGRTSAEHVQWRACTKLQSLYLDACCVSEAASAVPALAQHR